jgi:hypothetical protein
MPDPVPDPAPDPLPALPEGVDLFILACMPVSKEAQNRLGIALYTPTPGSVQVPCSGCSEPVWLGPRQRDQRAKLGDRAVFIIGCPTCLVTKYGLNPETPIASAGFARGGKYVMKDGRVIE